MSYPDVAALVRHPNVAAFLHVIRKGEAHDRDDDYTLINGGAHFTAPPWAHPFEGIPTTHGGKAAGAPQFLGTTWANLRKQHPDLLPDFSPPCQDIGAALLIIGRDGMDALLAGDFDTAVWRCRTEWTSLPGAAENNPQWNLAVARAYYLAHGGQMQESPPASATSPLAIPVPQSPKERTMDPLSIIAIVGPLLKALLPQIGAVIGGAKDAANAKVIGTVLDTVVQAAGTAPGGATATLATAAAAVEKMQAEPATLKVVQDAVLTHPDIAPLLTIVEVGGGAAAAAERDLKVMAADAPFWKTSAVFWVSMALLPMIYWYVGSSVVGGTEIPESWPWIAQVALKLFGPVWDPGARVGLANLIVGLVLGGICGVYYGISVTQQKQQQQTAAPEKSGS